MARKLLIFGNGLGMALNQDHFSLTNALQHVWNKPDFLTDEQRALISLCVGRDGPPSTEDEMDQLHRVVLSCRTLCEIDSDDLHWLTAEGRSFPEETARYIHKVATHLHNSAEQLPDTFVEPLISFLRETNSHVATLNYDRLLYDALADNDILSGYDGALIDGIFNRGFDADNLERRQDRRFGYYLHLHGSPLFYNQGSSIHKYSRREIVTEPDECSQHIVLTHVRHKKSVIAASRLLSAYWDYLQFAIQESSEVVLVGYSGLDTHLNELIKLHGRQKRIRVVEWSGSANNHWSWLHKLGNIDDLVRLDDILSFTNWA